jgi:ubiquinone/menaquinone biosynthesis C-methylase UbiE
MNGYGLATSIFDPFTKKFIEFSKSLTEEGHVLEIGAAYGAVSQNILAENDEVSLTINDMEPKHLSIFLKNLKTFRPGITVKAGIFPEQLDFKENSFDAILMARMLQYVAPKKLPEVVKKIHFWLKPNGKIYVVCKTPYIQLLSDFIPIYESRKACGKDFPGLINGLKSKVHQKANFDHIPDFINVFDPDVLLKLFNQAGFKIDACEFINRFDFPTDIALSGKEEVGLIATKLTL